MAIMKFSRFISSVNAYQLKIIVRPKIAILAGGWDLIPPLLRVNCAISKPAWLSVESCCSFSLLSIETKNISSQVSPSLREAPAPENWSFSGKHYTWIESKSDLIDSLRLVRLRLGMPQLFFSGSSLSGIPWQGSSCSNFGFDASERGFTSLVFELFYVFFGKLMFPQDCYRGEYFDDLTMPCFAS